MSDPSNLDQRIQVFRNMLASDPQNALASFSLGKLLLQTGETDEAEAAFRKSLEIDPRQSAAIQSLGQILVDAGRNEEAAEILERGVRLAHAKGEYHPRNVMQDLLRSIGVTPPDPEAESRAKGGESAGSGSGDWLCRRCGLDNARVETPPFASELGTAIAELICESCWNEWKRDMSIKVINEYRLDLSSTDGARIYDQHMREFLSLPE